MERWTMDSSTPIAAGIPIEPKENFVPSFEPQMELPLAVTSSPTEWLQFKKQIREVAQIILNEVLAHKEILFHLNHSRKQSLFKEIETSAKYLGHSPQGVEKRFSQLRARETSFSFSLSKQLLMVSTELRLPRRNFRKIRGSEISFRPSLLSSPV